MKEMYKGKVNSPATLLSETIDSKVTSIKVEDASVFPEGPNLAVIGNDGNAETIKYESINNNILVGCVRGFQGEASVWDKETIISRNFTEYDLDVIQENILELDKKELKDFQDDTDHRTVSDSEKEKWNNKIDKSQISKNINISGEDKVYNTEVIKKELSNKIDKVDGKDLSTNDFTDVEKDKLANIEEEAEKNKVNSVNNKTGDIILKISDLENDKTFKTEVEIQELINNSKKLKKEVVESLPSSGQDDIIYLLKNKNDANNVYTEYLWIGGKWEIIGDTKVDLTDYLTKEESLKNEKNLRNDFVNLGKHVNEELSNKADKSDIKTNLSEMTEDTDHRTVSDSEKEKWNGKSRNATFVIANYDSSENSKSGADYVIQENDCAAEIINSFTEKLPDYGGKIQLTEGNFNIKKDLAIVFEKNSIIIEGYGNATNIIDKLTKDERKSVIVTMPKGTENCRLSDLNITHEYGNSINIRGNKNYIKNVNIINNGTVPSLIINNVSENILENCSVKCDSSHCYCIIETSGDNSLSNCSGTSTNGQVFYINSSNNSLSNCSGTSTNGQVFDIRGSNNSLSNCSGTSTNSNAFYINSSNNSLSNCSGTSTNSNAFYIRGSGISLIGCIGETKNPDKKYDITFYNTTISCIALGNYYHNGGINNKGTNNIVVNNVKLEA